MTVSYSLDVSKARFCGFTKLLLRWRGSIYKIMWKEFLMFCVAYAVISVIYRFSLTHYQRDIFEKMVVFVDSFIDFIPLSFVLGFYVSLVVGRWWNQFEAISWPDRAAWTISSYVHGSDERSRKVRRTLGRYLILLQVLTFQIVSTAVKRRFPTTQHLVAAGIMTKEERSAYEKLNFEYGKFWLPCHWFVALATRARKEGRIKDNILLDGLIKEVFEFRTRCCVMVRYDWISVPLVYTQVVTIATFLYSVALLIGRQYLNPEKGYKKFEVDLYVPLFTLVQFFFYVGWLKVAEQILNPYGEDDDDFELNWLIDRAVNIVYMIVDHLHLKHPKVKQDAFWDEIEIHLPQTKSSANGLKNPQLGSVFLMDFEDPEYLPLEDVLEDDCADNQYEETLRRSKAERQNSSFIQRVFGSKISRKSNKIPATRTFSNKQGCSTLDFPIVDEIEDGTTSRRSLTSNSKPSNLKKLVEKISKSKKRTTISLSVPGEARIPNGGRIREVLEDRSAALRSASDPVVLIVTDVSPERNNFKDDDYEANSEDSSLDVIMMPVIPEEASRANSLSSSELRAAMKRGERASQQIEKVHELVKEASEVLHEISRSTAAREKWKDSEEKSYESCCSFIDDKDSSEDISVEEKDKDNDDKLFIVNEREAKVISVHI